MKQIVSKIKNSRANSRLLAKFQTNNKGFVKRLLNDIETRWFSKLGMLCSVRDNVEEINEVMKENANKITDDVQRRLFITKFIVTDYDKNLLTFVINIVTTLKSTSDLLSSEKMPTMSILCGEILHLEDRLSCQKTESIGRIETVMETRVIVSTTQGTKCSEECVVEDVSSENSTITETHVRVELHKRKSEFIESLQFGVKNYFYEGNYNILGSKEVMMACYFNPMTKLMIYPNYKELIDNVHASIEETAERIKTEEDNYHNECTNFTSIEDTSNTEATTVQSFEERYTKFLVRKSIQKTALSIQMTEYESQPVLDENSNITLTQYWRSKMVMWPDLAKAALRYTTLLCVSTPSERLFSKSGCYY
ncbi:hypothetical protein EIN_138770 [Entamoeba invadens IP1]|uniref:HAT C-terminal dimerisation domain-containing protein n=1 Tax=Entamoeba invadens IP1 TaxID=370355 RepID=A0A0A1TV33_ENTIV|nr:hypothetical protein EIN_138770 [Entamoeba invadens IP1]ELP84120.1 hypothetical protein EIN_138770 [Entamoeba invadens IP1]|eukprot:XP_004183466.1 hypothetical protein EIN_138770 [Entamoeba invadens IP1]